MVLRFTNIELCEVIKQSGHTFKDCKNQLKVLTDFVPSELNILFDSEN